MYHIEMVAVLNADLVEVSEWYFFRIRHSIMLVMFGFAVLVGDHYLCSYRMIYEGMAYHVIAIHHLKHR